MFTYIYNEVPLTYGVMILNVSFRIVNEKVGGKEGKEEGKRKDEEYRG